MPIWYLKSNSETASKKHKTPQFILEKRGALLDSIAMGIAPDIYKVLDGCHLQQNNA